MILTLVMLRSRDRHSVPIRISPRDAAFISRTNPLQVMWIIGRRAVIDDRMTEADEGEIAFVVTRA